MNAVILANVCVKQPHVTAVAVLNPVAVVRNVAVEIAALPVANRN